MTRMKLLRMQAGLTQRELGERLGVSQPMVSDWEGRKRPIPARHAERLSDELGCLPHQLQQLVPRRRS